jgi:hypothetical protein
MQGEKSGASTSAAKKHGSNIVMRQSWRRAITARRWPTGQKGYHVLPTLGRHEQPS